MSNITGAIYNIRYLDELSQRDTPLNRVDPTIKLIVTFGFIITTVSFGKYELGGLLPMFIFPAACMSLGELSYKEIIKRMLIALPFIIGIGIFNPLLDTIPVAIMGEVRLSGGWISFFSLLLKGILTVSSAIILIATTGIEDIAHSLRKLKVPKIFVILILLTYRYISVLMEEAASIWTAYSLRAPGEKGIRMEIWGSLLGQLLLRTYDRGQRVYEAMVLRGFHGDFEMIHKRNINTKDIAFLTVWLAFFLIFRIYDVPVLIEIFLQGVFQ